MQLVKSNAVAVGILASQPRRMAALGVAGASGCYDNWGLHCLMYIAEACGTCSYGDWTASPMPPFSVALEKMLTLAICAHVLKRDKGTGHYHMTARQPAPERDKRLIHILTRLRETARQDSSKFRKWSKTRPDVPMVKRIGLYLYLLRHAEAWGVKFAKGSRRGLPRSEYTHEIAVNCIETLCTEFGVRLPAPPLPLPWQDQVPADYELGLWKMKVTWKLLREENLPESLASMRLADVWDMLG